MPAHTFPMPKPSKHFEREVRRVRHLSAWIVLAGRADQECQVVDISANGAKVVADIPSLVPSRFELTFMKGNAKRRVCSVIWRRGKMIGVQFA
jgi:hypothetical protein